MASCTVSYTRSEVGQALVDAGFIQHARLYPDQWPSCATQLACGDKGLPLPASPLPVPAAMGS